MEFIILFSVVFYYFRLIYCDQQQQQQQPYFISVKQNNDTLAIKGKCEIPHPIIEYPPLTSEQFIPRATIVYRCADYIGCCKHYTEICVAVKDEIEQIDVEFLVWKRKAWVTRVYRFVNHTRCECREKTDLDEHLLSERSSSHKSDTGLSSTIIIGLIVMFSVLIIAMIALIVLVAIYYKKYKRYKRVKQNTAAVLAKN